MCQFIAQYLPSSSSSGGEQSGTPSYVEVVAASSVIAAVVTGIFGLLRSRRDNVREDKIREIERDAARQDRDTEFGRALAAEIAREGRAQQASSRGEAQRAARGLKSRLEALEAAFAGETNLGAFDTHSISRDHSLQIRAASRLVPDALLREYVALSMEVVAHMWVIAHEAQSPNVYAEQRRLLQEAITAVSNLATTGVVDEALDLSELEGLKDLIDETYRERYGSH